MLLVVTTPSPVRTLGKCLRLPVKHPHADSLAAVHSGFIYEKITLLEGNAIVGNQVKCQNTF